MRVTISVTPGEPLRHTWSAHEALGRLRVPEAVDAAAALATLMDSFDSIYQGIGELVAYLGRFEPNVLVVARPEAFPRPWLGWFSLDIDVDGIEGCERRITSLRSIALLTTLLERAGTYNAEIEVRRADAVDEVLDLGRLTELLVERLRASLARTPGSASTLDVWLKALPAGVTVSAAPEYRAVRRGGRLELVHSAGGPEQPEGGSTVRWRGKS